MSHCRYTNTLEALRECVDDLDRTSGLSDAESKARDHLLVLCQRIADDFDCEIHEIVTQQRRERIRARSTLNE